MKTQSLTEHLDAVFDTWTSLRAQESRNLQGTTASRFITSVLAVVRRVAGPKSAYAERADTIVAAPNQAAYNTVRELGGVLESLHTDASHGYLESASELLRADLFSDFLDMAQHLLDEGYKDASAVIAGSSLESHIRQLCVKFQVDTETLLNGDMRPKKADTMNADLVKAVAYGKLDQKSVTGWLDLRNNAAHGNYSAYQTPQVALLIAGVRDFITRNPA